MFGGGGIGIDVNMWLKRLQLNNNNVVKELCYEAGAYPEISRGGGGHFSGVGGVPK